MTSQYLNYLGVAMPVSSASTKTYWGNGVSSTLVGSGGDDTFYVWSQNDEIVETAGAMATDIAAIYGSYEYVLPANVENLTISGTVTTAVGNTLSNLIIAQGSTNMTIDGDGGNDDLVGNTGADTFVMQPGYGHEVIYDFNSTDVIRLANFGIDRFAQLAPLMTQNGQDVVITPNANDSVILRDTTLSELKASNFELSLDPENLKMTFDDEFNTFTSSPNGSEGWMTTFPYPGASARSLGNAGETEYYSDTSVGVNPFSDSNGVLTIRASPATPGVQTPAGSGLTYTSGLITTYKSFSQLYGYFEVRAQLPSGSGFWPAFWLLPENNTWPPELDVFEVLGNDPGTAFETAHTNIGGENTMTHFNTYVSTATTGFNTYGVDWEKNTITWYVNGVAVASMATPADMGTPMYMLLNLGVGTTGSEAGAANGTSSASMLIDYVRAYSSMQGLAPVSIATFLAHESTLNQTPGGFAVSDTAASILANIAALNADAANISSIDPTDVQISLSAATFLANRMASELIDGGVAIVDTAADISVKLDALGDPNIASIVDSTNHPIGVSVAQLTTYASTLAKLKNENGSSYRLFVSDTAADLASGIAAVAANAHIASIAVTSGEPVFSVATFSADRSTLDLISGGFAISDSAADVLADLAGLAADSAHLDAIDILGASASVSVGQLGQDRGILDKIVGGFAVADKSSTIAAAAGSLNADEAHITAIAATGGVVTVSAATFLADQAALDKVVGGVDIADTAADIVKNLGALSADASYIDAIDLTDQGTPTLNLTSAQASSSIIAKIATPFVENLTNSGGSTTTAGHVSSLTIAASGAEDDITGGASADTFVFQKNFGHDEITDFATYLGSSKHDVVSLPSSEFGNFAAVLADASQVGSSVALTAANGDTLTLANMTLSMLASAKSDFSFHV